MLIDAFQADFFDIIFIRIAFAGSGLTFIAGHHFVRARAANREDEFAMGKLNPEVLNLSLKSFKKLPKDYISKQVFEIKINGIHYDIYATVQHGDNITLYAINDKAENALVHAMEEKNKQHLTTKVFPFFLLFRICKMQ